MAGGRFSKTSIAASAVAQINQEINKIFGFFAPWLLLALAPIFSLLFYALWHDYPVIIACFFIFSAVVLSGLTWKLSHTRKFIGKAHNVISILFIVIWVGMAATEGLWTRPVLDIGLSFGILLCLTWNLRTVIRNRDEDESIAWPKIAGEVGLEGTKWKNLPGSGNKISGMLQMLPGRHTFSDATNAKERIASALKIPANGVRITRNPDNASQAFVSAVKEDFLRKEVSWSAPGFVGKSIADGPIRLGIYEDGEEAYLNLYSKTGARHLLISGMNGAGKSVGARVILTDLFSRTDVAVWAIDTVKGAQTLGCAVDGLDWFITKKPAAEAMMDKVLDVVQARADYLGQKRLDVWEPGCGLTYLVILIEEAPAVIRDADAAIRIVERARSAGISLIISIQRASYSNMPTDLRAQLGTVLCFGVKTEIDARFALSDDVIERGADPSIWQQRKPGYAYLQAPEVDEDKEITPLRVFNISNKEVMAHAGVLQSDPLDSITRNAIGKMYEEYKQEQHTVAVDTAGNAVIDGEVIPDSESALIASYDDEATVVEKLNEMDEEPDIVVDINQPIKVDPDEEPKKLNVIRGDARLKPEEARRVMDNFFNEKKSEGQRRFAPRDLYEVAIKAGRSRPWIHSELDRRMGEGSIRYTDEDDYWIV